VTKSQLIEVVAEKLGSGFKRRDVEAIVETIFKSMTDALVRDDRIEIRGFGAFTVRKRKARQGRNPKTGQAVQVPGKNAPFFTPGKDLKERVNSKAALGS
jgi:integration host factor subunit beta